MKNTILMAAASLVLSAAQAQDTTASTGNAGTMGNTTPVTDTTKKLNAYGSYSTRDSIAAKYKLLPMPAPLTQEKIFPVLGSYQLSSGESATASTDANVGTGTTTTTGTTSTATTGTVGAAGTTTTTGDVTAVPNVTVTLDSASKGMVWIDGLPQGRMKAFLKKSPATYRIIAQKTQSGTSIPEGTLHFDPQTNIMHIVLGAPYNEADPTGVFALSAGTTPEDNTAEVKVKTKNTKMKSKLQFYTATKVLPQQDQQQGTGNGFENGLQQAQQTNTGNQ